MVISNVKYSKKSVQKLRGLRDKHTQLKLKIKSKAVNKKKVEQMSTNHDAVKTTSNLKTKKLEKVKTCKKLGKISEDETDTITTLKLQQSQEENKSNPDSTQSTELQHHVDEHKNLASQCEESEDAESRENKNVVSKANSLRLLKSHKQKKMDKKNITDNTDILNQDLSKEHILQCISAIFHLTQEQLKNKIALFEGENHSVFMQVTCIRVPKMPRRNMRILLPYSIVSSNDDVALFVGDLQRGRRKDYEPTIEYYEDLLKKCGSTLIKSIIPMNQVKTEYDQYELKRKLVGSYDHFLVDGKIAGHLSHLLGKEFYNKRKLPTSIRMNSKDLKHEIEYALRKTNMQLHSFGDSHLIQIGHTSMKENEVLENVLTACSHLSKNYPGGWDNIRSIHIKTATSLALPIYMTLKNKNSVEVPIIQPKRPKAYYDVKGELSTVPGKVTVSVTPEGEVTVTKKIKRE